MLDRVSFFSDGLRLDGDLHIPDSWRADEPLPAVIACSGYQGLKVIHPARFARALVPHGYVVLGFDYRGFGRSDGERGRLVPQDQVRDVRSAISLLETRPEVDPQRIALLGWALGGGVVLAAAAEDPRVRAVAACNAIGDGRRSTRFMHDQESWARLLELIAEDRTHRVLYGRSRLVHPFEVVRLDNVTDDYVQAELYKAAGFGSDVTIESADYLLDFAPELVVDRIAPRPLLLIHGAENRLHSVEEAQCLFERARDPKRLILLEGKGHTEWMFDDDPTFLRVRDALIGFLTEALAPPQTAGRA